VQLRMGLAALAALLLLAAVLPQGATSEHALVAGDGGDEASPTVAVDREGPRGETVARPHGGDGTPDPTIPVAEHREVADQHAREVDAEADGPGAGAEEDDHRPTEGEAQVVYSYGVEVRGEVVTDPGEFAEATARILTDARGWTLGGSLAFVRSDDEPHLTVVLANPDEVAATHEVCSRDYSCRVEDEILINDRNWREATPAWHEAEGDLATYRRYLINHEVGHFLGFGHFECGGAGELAPVMQQQSVSTQDCEPNGWPLDWEREELARQLQVSVREPEPS
jgi:hypothetical protein